MFQLCIARVQNFCFVAVKETENRRLHGAPLFVWMISISIGEKINLYSRCLAE